LDSITSFRSLREIDFGADPIDWDTIFLVLDKSPKLLSITASISKKMSTCDRPPTEYKLEHLRLLDSGRNKSFTDHDLMTIADRFPKLVRFTLSGYAFISNSCLSFFANRYGNQLVHLEIKRLSRHFQTPYEPLGIFDGIGQCRNLKYLSIAGSDAISDDFAKALTTGCIQLTTLVIDSAKQLTHNNLIALALLPNLTRLNMNYVGHGFSAAVSHIALQGRLEQLLAKDGELSAACLKTCVQYCPRLTLLSGAARFHMTADDGLEIVNLYAQYGISERLVIRSRNGIWLDERIREKQNELINQNTGGRHFVIDRSAFTGFLDEAEDICGNDNGSESEDEEF